MATKKRLSDRAIMANRRRWADALLSGKFLQGEGYLRFGPANWRLDRTEDTFCCLGVYCHITKPRGWKASDDKGFYHTLSAVKSTGFLGEDFLLQVGLSATDMHTLTNLNDGTADVEEDDTKESIPFDMIAALILILPIHREL